MKKSDDCIAVDVGNTRISCAVFKSDQLVDLQHHAHADGVLVAKMIASRAQGTGSPIALCSVVPAVAGTMTAIFAESRVQFCEVIADKQSIVSGIYPTMGADRVANMAAARIYARDRAALVLDFGTATTLTAVDACGKFLGGFITLGLAATFSALHNSTAQLPDLSGIISDVPDLSLAFTTAEAIQSGTLLAHTGAVEHWIKTAREQIGTEAAVIATGGLSGMMSAYSKTFDYVEPNLTLFGIKLIAQAATDPADRV
ncbi:MAG TPA: type III pantothenate kinase [Chroococcales cyanobacterium]